MSLKCFVKVGLINNLSDARYSSGMNVNQLGYLLEENNKNSIDINTLKEISAWISGTEIVGEFNNSTVEFINNNVKKFPFDYIQVNYPLSIKKISYDINKIILNIDLKKSIKPDEFFTDIFDNYNDISVININYLDNASQKLINNNHKKFKLLNGFNHSKIFINKMIKQNFFYGISLRGNNEIKPGYKDYSSLSEVFDFLDIS